jgi:hypothetical protein
MHSVWNWRAASEEVGLGIKDLNIPAIFNVSQSASLTYSGDLFTTSWHDV